MKRACLLAAFTILACNTHDDGAPAPDDTTSANGPTGGASAETPPGQGPAAAVEPKPAGKRVHLRAWNGQYLAAELGGGDALVANRDAAGVWETFTLVDANGGELESGDEVRLRAHDDVHYVTALEDAARSVVVKGLTTGAAETFAIVRLEGPGVVRNGDAITLRAKSGSYVAAEGGGGAVLHADRASAGPWETFRVNFEGAIVHPSALVGRLRADGTAFVDLTGPVNPVFCHFGEAFSRYVRDPAAVLAQLDRIAKAGYHGIRFWTTLGGSYWAGREVGDDVTPGYWGKLTEFLRELRARQLRAVISQGDIGRIVNRAAFADELSDVLDAVGSDTAAIVEGGNEAWQTGEPNPTALAQFVGLIDQRHPSVLYTLTSPPGETAEELDAWSLPPADLFDVHGYRGGHWWDKVRHVFSIAYEQKPAKTLGWQGEPTGPGDAVSVTVNKQELDDDTLAAMAAMSIVARQAWCYMSGPGVLFDSPIDAQPGFWSVPRAVAALPRDVMRYEQLIHGGTSWSAQRIFAAQGETRVDQRIASDGRFVAIAYGPALDYVQTRPATIVKVTDLGGKARIIEGHL